MQRKWAFRWGVFILVALSAFAALEGPAVMNDAPGDTLSEFIRVGIQHSPEMGGAALISFLCWFAWHILRKL